MEASGPTSCQRSLMLLLSCRRLGLAAAVALACSGPAHALGRSAYVATTPGPGQFVLVQGGAAASIWVDQADWPGVVRAARDLQADIARVTAVTPAIGHAKAARPRRARRHHRHARPQAR